MSLQTKSQTKKNVQTAKFYFSQRAKKCKKKAKKKTARNNRGKMISIMEDLRTYVDHSSDIAKDCSYVITILNIEIVFETIVRGLFVYQMWYQESTVDTLVQVNILFHIFNLFCVYFFLSLLQDNHKLRGHAKKNTYEHTKPKIINQGLLCAVLLGLDLVVASVNDLKRECRATIILNQASDEQTHLIVDLMKVPTIFSRAVTYENLFQFIVGIGTLMYVFVQLIKLFQFL